MLVSSKENSKAGAPDGFRQETVVAADHSKIPTNGAVGNGIIPVWHAGFLLLMPVIRRHVGALFRHLSLLDRNEALAEVTAVAMMRYLEQLEFVGAPSFDPDALADWAARHVLHDGRACGRVSRTDVLSPSAQHQNGFAVEHLQTSCDAEQLKSRIDLRTDGEPIEPLPSSDPRASRGRKAAVNEPDQSQSVRFNRERRRRRVAEMRLDANDLELASARRIQQKLLPAAAPALCDFDIAGMTCPADATGGDFFDYVPMLDNCVGIVIGDVSGHGFGSALLMAATRAYLRAFAETQSDVGALLSSVNRVLGSDIDDERFVTLVLVCLDPRTRSLVYASAGHPTGYILDATGQLRLELPSTGSLLGPGSDGAFAASPIMPLEPCDLVLLLSDGVIEAPAPDGTAFGWARAVSIVGACRHDSASRIVAKLYHAVRAFGQNEPQVDDVTAVVMKVGSGRFKVNAEHGPKAIHLRIT